MTNQVKSYLQLLEAEYEELKAKVKKEKATGQIKGEDETKSLSDDFRQQLEDVKASAGQKQEEAKKEINQKWSELKSKWNELLESSKMNH